jgi:ketosteroid isomerase-like protein
VTAPSRPLRRLVALVALLAVLPSVAAAAFRPGGPGEGASGAAAQDKARAAAVLDDWHDAAAKADEARYFGHFAADGVFLGTDVTERWTVAEFRAWAKKYFDRGKAWSFRATQRHVRLSADGSVAWFDELLDTPNMGTCRASGVLVKSPSGWKISHYDLHVPVPNELMDKLVADIRAFEKKAPAPSPTPKP